VVCVDIRLIRDGISLRNRWIAGDMP